MGRHVEQSLLPMNRFAHLIFVVCLTTVVGFAADFHIGDNVQLAAQHPAGVPVRNQPGESQYYRWPDRAEGVVTALQGNSVQVEVATKRGWILPKYLIALEAPADEGTEAATITVGAWNLEHMHDGEKRGFPELVGSNALPPRTNDDYNKIAEAIRDRIGTAVIMLSEIAGVPGQRTSMELDRLTGLLGSSWKYTIGSSGGINGAQRVAILYDEARVEALLLDEIMIPKDDSTGDDIFNRDPLLGYFRIRKAGGNGNDFIAIALHLASGQNKVANHNAAMAKLREKLTAFCHSKPALQNERDVILGGDINASRYDTKKENFWENYDSAGFAFTTLAPEDGDDYLATRLKGRPLFPGSQIDYLFASAQMKNSLTLPLATVHHELASSGDFLMYRRNYSDHFPVTVTILVHEDID